MFIDDTITYVENPKKNQPKKKKFLEPIHDYVRLQDTKLTYKINCYPNTDSKQVESEIENAIPLY